MSEDLNITVDGTPLSFIAPWGEAVVTHRWPYGSWDLKWQMQLPPNFRHPALRRGAEVFAYVGASRVWAGEMTDPDMDSLEFVASGLARQAERTVCKDGSGNPTSTPSVAVGWGILNGALNWSGLSTISSTPFVDGQVSRYNTVAELLDAVSTSLSERWWVTPRRYLRHDLDPTEPSWMVTPGAGVLGVADEEFVTHLYGTYKPRPGVTAHVTAVDTSQNLGRVEREVDLTSQGYITQAKAQTLLNSMLAAGRARTGWTNGIDVGRGQILSMGGTPVALSRVRAGQMVHLAGLRDERGLSASTDIVLGETIWKVKEDILTLNPVGLAARDFASVVESMGGSLL